MAIQDSLPDRPLSMEEFRELQSSDQFDEVTTSDTPPGADEDHLFIRVGDDEYTLHYTEESGWHKCDTEGND